MLCCRLLHCLVPVDTLTTEGCSERGHAMHLSNHVFQSEYFWNYLSYEAENFFQNLQNFMQNLKAS